MFRRVALPLLVAASLFTSCGPRTPASVAGNIALTGAGSFDRNADSVQKLQPRTRRQVVFGRRVPVPARQMTVIYETEFRPSTWRAEIVGARFSLRSLSDAPPEQVGTWGGAPAVRFVTGPLRGIIARDEGAGHLSLVTSGYADRYEPDLKGVAGQPLGK